MIYTTPTLPDELYHFGIKGMKWGIRRYQNEDGTLTPAGKKRYGSEDGDIPSKKKGFDRNKAIKIGAAVAGTALAAYGAYKVSEYVRTNNAVKDIIKEVDIFPRARQIHESAVKFAEYQRKYYPNSSDYDKDYNMSSEVPLKYLYKDMEKGGRYDNLRKKLVKDQTKFNRANRINKVKDVILPEGYYYRDENGHRTNKWIKAPRVKPEMESPMAKYAKYGGMSYDQYVKIRKKGK